MTPSEFDPIKFYDGNNDVRHMRLGDYCYAAPAVAGLDRPILFLWDIVSSYLRHSTPDKYGRETA